MITHIVSDMGGVLIHIEWAERVGRLLGREIPMAELHHLWISARSTLDFESGRTSFDEFTAAFIQEFGLNISPAAFQHEFLEIVQDPLPNCIEMLIALKQSYHLSLLSNTSAPHCDRVRDRAHLFDHFDQLFLSYQLGTMKPSPDIYQHVLSALQTPPETVAFFDDSARNVQGASQVGIQAYQVNSPDEILAIVRGWPAGE